MSPTRIPPAQLSPTGMHALLVRTLLLGAMLALVGCGEPSTSQHDGPAQPQAKQTVAVAYGVDMQSVNELITSGTAIHTALHYYALFLPLLEELPDFEKGPPTFAPRLAESYSFSDDRRQLTFHLRQDVVWSDGVPVTAEDVRWTWQAQIDPDIAWDQSDVKEQITDVEVVDAHTARFHFSQPYATQVLDANLGVILPKHAWSALPFSEWRSNAAWFQEHLVVNGPFTLAAWEPQQRIVIERNPTYFEPDLPRVDRIAFLITPDLLGQLTLLRSGRVQMADWVPPPHGAEIANDPDLEVIVYLPRQYVYLCWNLKRPYFSDKRVRHALTMAIDRQGIIDALYYGYARVTTSPFPSNSWAFDPELEPLPYDIEAATQLLDESGWVDSDGDGVRDKDGVPFRFEILTNSDNQLRTDVLVMIQEQLRQVGIEAQPRPIEFNTMISRTIQHDFDATIVNLSINTNLNLYYNFHSNATDDGYNWGFYTSPEADRLIDEITAQIDQLEARPLYVQLQHQLQEDQPVTFLYEPRNLVGIDKRLKNVDPNALSRYFHMRRWELRDEE